MNPLDELSQSFTKFPGIGPRQARRFAYFILRSGSSYTQKLAGLINTVPKSMRICPISFQYFAPTEPTQTYAPLITDPSRDSRIMMIVEKDTDIDAIEKSHAFSGHYFVLGGLAPILDTDLSKSIRIDELLRIIEQKCTGKITRDLPWADTVGISEIIFALSAHPEGDRTAQIVKQKLSPWAQKYEFTISQLGRGFSTGTEVEYSDPDTLASAFQNRK